MNLLVSACLLGVRCRYDGQSKPVEGLAELQNRFTLIPVCPEVLGGLPTPRTPSECRCGRVVSQTGTDVTEAYCAGAEETLRIAEMAHCTCALLKERSPSCGCGTIYDGSFTGTLREGNGVTAQLLLDHGIRVYGESRVPELLSNETNE